MMHPEFEILTADDPDAALHSGRIVPVYEAASKITSRVFRSVIWRLLERMDRVPDPLPASVRDRLALPDRDTALRRLHFPAPDDDVRLLNSFRGPAQWRMIFEEFFWLESGLALKKSKARLRQGISFALSDKVREQIKRMLPFKPTNAQKRALKEIADDMAAPHPMYRLLQGDVGSGKTLVAAQAAIIAIENGYQTALLAPTEILATQHYFSLRDLFKQLGYQVILLTGSGSKKDKAALKRLLAAGLVHVAVGTHALIEEDVEFKGLGLVIIDEQHRFGVEQRLQPRREGRHSRRSGHDRDADSADARTDHLRRPRHFRNRRTPAGTEADPHETREGREDRAGVEFREEGDRGRAAGLCRVPVDRRIGDDGHEGRAEHARTAVHGGVSPICAWVCCTDGSRRTRRKR